MAQRDATPQEILRIALIAVLILIPVFVFRSYLSHPFVNPHLPSPPYEWPDGCGPTGGDRGSMIDGHLRFYGPLSKVPKSCMVNKYFFADAGKYNFLQTRAAGWSGRNYYRIDRDAVNLVCNRSPDDKHCTVTNFVEDAFIDDKN